MLEYRGWLRLRGPLAGVGRGCVLQHDMQCITMQCMESQLTVRLPEDLSAALEQAARHSGRRTSEIVRAALREYLQLAADGGRRPAERVRGLIGSLDSGMEDLAERHRSYILESLKRGR